MKTQTALNPAPFAQRLGAACASVLVSTALLGSILLAFDAKTQHGPAGSAGLAAAGSTTRI